MKTKKLAGCLVAGLLLLLTSYNFALGGYGYGESGDDPLIKMFKDIIIEAKKPEKNWDNFDKIVREDAKQPIKSLDDFFGLNLYSKFEQALKENDLKKVIDCTANLIFLSMMEKYELVLRDEFKDYNFDNGRLALCDKYYREIFKGNVLKYDEKNGTKINEAISDSLKKIPSTGGKPSKFGVGGEPPHLERYKEMYYGIRDNLLKVFPYFEIKK